MLGAGQRLRAATHRSHALTSRCSHFELFYIFHILKETLASQKEKLAQGIILTPGAAPASESRASDETRHEPEEKRPRKGNMGTAVLKYNMCLDSGDKLWYERVKPNANIQHLLEEHSYLNEMDVTNMSYDEYLERFRYACIVYIF